MANATTTLGTGGSCREGITLFKYCYFNSSVAPPTYILPTHPGLFNPILVPALHYLARLLSLFSPRLISFLQPPLLFYRKKNFSPAFTAFAYRCSIYSRLLGQVCFSWKHYHKLPCAYGPPTSDVVYYCLVLCDQPHCFFRRRPVGRTFWRRMSISCDDMS